MQDYLGSLRTDAWRTAGSRYNASRRLRRRETFSAVSLAFFSAMSVAVAFLQRIYATPASPLDSYLTALSACLGIFLLAISLMEWGAGNGAKAETLHRNAEELNEFQRRIKLRLAQVKAGQTFAWADVERLREDYEAVKSRCPYNHAPIDDELFLGQHANAPELLGADGKPRVSEERAWWLSVCSYIASIWYFVGFWILLGLAFSPLLTCVWPTLNLAASCKPS